MTNAFARQIQDVTPPKFNQLPAKLILLIFKHLPPRSALALLNTEKFFRKFKTSKPVEDKTIEILDPEFFDTYLSLCALKKPRAMLGIPLEKKKNQPVHQIERLLTSLNKQTTQEKQILYLRAATSTSYFVQQ